MDYEFEAPKDKTAQEIYEGAISSVVRTINLYAQFDKHKADALYCELCGVVQDAFETDDTKWFNRETIGKDIRAGLSYEPFAEANAEIRKLVDSLRN